MSGYIRDESGYVYSFALRTLSNLQLIQHIHETDKNYNAYEVTQLINSMIGLLVFPKEKYYRDIQPYFQFAPQSPEKELFDRLNDGKCSVSYYKDRNCTVLLFSENYNFKSPRDLLCHLRNALCHDNLEIEPIQYDQDNNGEIEGFSFSDYGRVKNNTILSNAQLKKYAQCEDDTIKPIREQICMKLSVDELECLLIGLCKFILRNAKEGHCRAQRFDTDALYLENNL